MTVTSLCIGDIHFDVKYFAECELLCKNILNIAKDLLPDFIVIMGDTLPTNNKVRTETQTLAVELFAQLQEIAQLIVIIGNHDIPGPTCTLSKYHGFSALHYWTNTKVVDTVPITLEIKGKKFSFCPYVSKGKFEETMNMCDWKYSIAVFNHQEFRGCEYGGHVSSSKDVWDYGKKIGIGGHIHQYSKLGEYFTYVGSSRQTKINESPYKTVSFFEFIEEGVYTEKRISTGLAPKMKLKIKADCLEEAEVPDTGNIKIEIIGTFVQNQAARKHLLVKKWKKLGFGITYTDLKEKRKQIEYEKKDLIFSEVCYELVKGDELLEELYKEIFE